ncbi:MAG: type I restriction endonuclease subunit R, EcoR124 family, partial [Brevinema sp.]
MLLEEQKLELAFIDKLVEMGYEYRKDIKTIDMLHQNFKEKIEYWNKIELSNREFEQILRDLLGKSVFDSTGLLHTKYTLQRDDDTSINLTLYDTKNWCQNTFEVVNQLRADHDLSHHRYDVHILINGIPMVHVELKHAGITPIKALKQIVRYKQDNGSSLRTTLLGFTQIFIMSNDELTYYFVNNDQLDVNQRELFIPVFMWADKDNNKCSRLLREFAPSFLEKCFLSRMISRFIVRMHSTGKLMILRPYQVHAVDSIIQQINESYSNGYIWHTTGSGKTLTSFKCATILRENDAIHKVLFVVDRKDLDTQTIEEFNAFEEGCVDPTSNTDHLLAKMLDPTAKIVVTTLQKMNRLLARYAEMVAPLKDKKMVFIFDECHRSQFGDSNKAIRETFTNSQLFGFTGTPIFGVNSKKLITENKLSKKITTSDIFDEELHQYLIADAINDKNVLPFLIAYYESDVKIDYDSQDWKKAVVRKILDGHAQLSRYQQFNAILTVSSIKDAIAYYEEFQKSQQDRDKKINVANIFSPPPFIKTDIQEDLETEKEEYSQETEQAQNYKKEALERIIADYNAKYHKDFNLNSANDTNNFMGYYKDIAKRMKEHHDLRVDEGESQTIDVLIVVDMFLTGFDSKFINTMYVDKNLEYHGLIQAFSRTNRIYNNVKSQGNIYCFRNLKEQVDKALTLFSGKEHKDVETFWEAKSHADIVHEYQIKARELKDIFEREDLEFVAGQAVNLKDKGAFYATFQEMVKLRNMADQHINDDNSPIEEAFSADEYKRFHRVFLEERRSPFIKDKPEETPEDSPSFDLLLDLYHKDIIDREYIENLVVDCIMGNTIRHEGTKEELAEKIFGDVHQIDYGHTMWRFMDGFSFKNQTRAQIVKALRDFVQAENDQIWSRLAKDHNLDLSKLLDLRDAYNDCGSMQQHLYDMLEATFAHQNLEMFAIWDERDRLLPIIKPYLEKNYEEFLLIRRAEAN